VREAARRERVRSVFMVVTEERCLEKEGPELLLSAL
jgi:hypothetical protein